MSGPEHYRAAEILLGNLRQEMAGSPGTLLRTEDQQARMLAEAQVHATLALVAAQVDATASRGPGDYNDEFLQVTT